MKPSSGPGRPRLPHTAPDRVVVETRTEHERAVVDREHAVEDREHAVTTREDAVRAREEGAQDRADREALMLQLREANKQLVISNLRAQALAEEAEQAEERFRLAIEAAPTAMLVVDARGAITYVNALTEPLFGYARDEIVGKAIDELVPARFRARHAEDRRAFSADPARRPMGAGRDLYALRKDGTEVPVEIGLSPFETAEGGFTVAAVTDITDRKRAEAALRDLDRRKNEFLTTVSHELRNPVNALKLHLLGVVRAARRSRQSLPRSWVLDRVTQATDDAGRLERLLENLLDVSRISEGQLRLEPEDVDLGGVVQAVVERFRQKLRDRKVTLNVTPVVGRWDPIRLEQIVTNLLSNAVAYGEGKPIEISVTADPEVAWLHVTDHGVGMRPEDQRRLFERFARVLPDRHHGGFGLGLWITKRLIDAMAGRILVESRPGGGSTFSVTLPRRGA